MRSRIDSAAPVLLLSAFALIASTALLSCKDPHRKAAKREGAEAIQAASSAPVFSPLDTAALFSKLMILQDSISWNPGDRNLVNRYLRTSLDTVSGCFHVVGKGVVNKDYPESAQKMSRKMAAEYTGKRWTMYLKAWNAGLNISYGRTISGSVLYSEELYERILDDTLCLLLKVPIGSIVLE